MTWDGSGDFNRVHNFSADASASIGILASRQDAEWANFEGGLENCLTRDGQNSPSGNLPMGGFVHTGAGLATSATNYLRADQYIRQMPIYATFGGTAETMSVSTEFMASLTAGVHVLVSCPSANTSASVTMNLNGLGDIPVRTHYGARLSYGQTRGLREYVYNGSEFVIKNSQPTHFAMQAAFASAVIAVSSATTTADLRPGIVLDPGWTPYPITVSAGAFKLAPGLRRFRITAQMQLLARGGGGVTYRINKNGTLIHTTQVELDSTASSDAVTFSKVIDTGIMSCSTDSTTVLSMTIDLASATSGTLFGDGAGNTNGANSHVMCEAW